MTKTLTLDTALDITRKHSYEGSIDDIVTLSLTISRSKKVFDKSIYKIFTEKSNINPKIYSNLKKIGDTMDDLPIDAREEVCRSFPPHYRTIYSLCSLRPDEIQIAVKKKSITKDMSYRESEYLVKQIRFPSKLVTETDKGRWSKKQEHLYSIFRSTDVYLGGERTYSFEEDLRRLCKNYGLTFRKPNQSISIKSIRHQERRERSLYWRQVIEKELPPIWFIEKDDKWKKMFNLKQAKVREMREENYQKMVGEWKKDKGFDMDTLGHTQKKRMVSPTSKSSVRPFKPKPLTEEQIFDRELAKIIEELESE